MFQQALLADAGAARPRQCHPHAASRSGLRHEPPITVSGETLGVSASRPASRGNSVTGLEGVHAPMHVAAGATAGIRLRLTRSPRKDGGALCRKAAEREPRHGSGRRSRHQFSRCVSIFSRRLPALQASPPLSCPETATAQSPEIQGCQVPKLLYECGIAAFAFGGLAAAGADVVVPSRSAAFATSSLAFVTSATART